MKTALVLTVLILAFTPPLDTPPQCGQPVFARNNPMLCNNTSSPSGPGGIMPGFPGGGGSRDGGILGGIGRVLSGLTGGLL